MKNPHFFPRFWIIGLLTAFLIIAFPGADADAWTRGGEAAFWASLDTPFRYSPVYGYIQIPQAGTPGTTSSHLPTLDCLGFEGAFVPDFSLTIGRYNNAFYAGARLMDLKGSDGLDTTLTSYSTTFPAGVPIDSYLRLNQYRFGYQYHFLYYTGNGTGFGFNPSIGMVLLDFRYSMDAPGGLSAERVFMHGAPELGLNLEWRPKGRLSLSADVTGSLPFDHEPFVLSADLDGNLRLWDADHSIWFATLGVGYEKMEFRDTQNIPNHIKVAMGPEAILGFKVFVF